MFGLWWDNELGRVAHAFDDDAVQDNVIGGSKGRGACEDACAIDMVLGDSDANAGARIMKGLKAMRTDDAAGNVRAPKAKDAMVVVIIFASWDMKVSDAFGSKSFIVGCDEANWGRMS